MTPLVTTLIFSQILFYITVSLAIIVLGVMIGLAVYHIIKIAKSLEVISENIENLSSDLQESIEGILGKLSVLPFFSMFFKRKTVKEKTKTKTKVRKTRKRSVKK